MPKDFSEWTRLRCTKTRMRNCVRAYQMCLGMRFSRLYTPLLRTAVRTSSQQLSGVTMKQIFIATMFCLFASNLNAQDDCHPQCFWVCDDPVCTASCQASCSTTCPTTPCDDQDCHCASFSEPSISNCTPPLSAPCTTCQLEQIGSECKNSNGTSCSCTLLCNQECTWDCQTPNCKEPNCQLQCERPACDVSAVFP